MSSSVTATAACAMIGPSSISGVTKCTVQPWIRTPASSARACVSSPLNDGRRAGWMLIIRPSHRAHEVGGEQPHVAGERDDLGAAPIRVPPLSPRHVLPCRHEIVASMTCASMPRAAAKASPSAFGWSEMTATISAGNERSEEASTRAAMLEPRPEIRIATFAARHAHSESAPRYSTPASRRGTMRPIGATLSPASWSTAATCAA